MLQNFKYGKPFLKNENSLSRLITYCDKNPIEMKKNRNNSVNGVSEKYDWNEISKKYSNLILNLI